MKIQRNIEITTKNDNKRKHRTDQVMRPTLYYGLQKDKITKQTNCHDDYGKNTSTTQMSQKLRQ